MRPLAALLLLLGTALWSPAARAVARLDGIPPRVIAGSRLEIAWSGLEAGTREVELELSLAGGRWMRISPELEAREGRYRWRVPPDLAGPARLRLRFGGDGFESETEVASEFVIEPGPDAQASRPPSASREEWWRLGRLSGGTASHRFGTTASLARAESLPAIAPDGGHSLRIATPVTTSSGARASWITNCTPRRSSGGALQRYPLRI